MWHSCGPFRCSPRHLVLLLDALRPGLDRRITAEATSYSRHYAIFGERALRRAEELLCPLSGTVFKYHSEGTMCKHVIFDDAWSGKAEHRRGSRPT